MSETTTPETCSICERPIPVIGTWMHGNNAQPITDGRCCDDCNANFVLPERMARMRRNEDPREVRVFHPFPGNGPVSQRAWMNMLLEPEGDGAAGYTQPCTLWLTTAELHNLITMLARSAEKCPVYSEDGQLLGSRKVMLDLAKKLEAAFQAGLRGPGEGRRRQQ